MSLLHAPSVSYPVGRSRFLAGLLLLLWLLAATVTLAWWQDAAAGDPGPWLGLASWLISGLVGWWGWQRIPAGRLVFQDGSWTWEGSDVIEQALRIRPEPVLDLQRLMLIRLQPQAGLASWVWADAANDPGRWLDLRRAVFARPHNPGVSGPAPGPDAQP